MLMQFYSTNLILNCSIKELLIYKGWRDANPINVWSWFNNNTSVCIIISDKQMNIVRAIWKYMYIGSQRCMRKLLSLPSTIKIFLAKYENFVLAGQNIMLLAFYYVYHQYIRNNKKNMKKYQYQAPYQVFYWIKLLKYSVLSFRILW